MPADWIPNIATQIERAIRAYLIEQGAASAEDCHISTDYRTRNSDNISIIARVSTTGHAELSGNELYQVSIQHRFQALPPPEEPNPEQYRINLDKSVGRAQLAMMNGESGTLSPTCSAITAAGRALATAGSTTLQENNADMTEFTCLSVRYLGATRGQPDDSANHWMEVRNYEVGACPANVD